MLADTALVSLAQALSYLRIDTPVTKINNEMVDRGDGETTEFDLASIPIAGTLKVYLDGEEAEDYTLTVQTIIFDEAPGDGVKIIASYDAYSGTLLDYDELLLESLIEAATKKAEDYTERCFVQREITENHIGDGTRVLKLYRQPILSYANIDSVKIDGEELEADIDYKALASIGRLYRNEGWPDLSEIEVVYTSGYAETRDEVQVIVPDAMRAVLLIIGFLFESRIDRVDSVNISGLGSISYNLPSQALDLLKPLKVSVI